MLTADEVYALARRQQKGEDVLADEEDYNGLYQYFLPEMPYGTAKARTGDPHVWIEDRLDEMVGLAQC